MLQLCKQVPLVTDESDLVGTVAMTTISSFLCLIWFFHMILRAGFGADWADVP